MKEVEMNVQPAFYRMLFYDSLKNLDFVLVIANCLHGLKQQVRGTTDS